MTKVMGDPLMLGQPAQKNKKRGPAPKRPPKEPHKVKRAFRDPAVVKILSKSA